MNLIDWFINILCVAGLFLLAVRALVAYDQEKWGRFAFCVTFGLSVLRSFAIRWLTGGTEGAIYPNYELAQILSSAPVFILTYIALFVGLAWVTLEEYKSFKDDRRTGRKIQTRLKNMSMEINRLNIKSKADDKEIRKNKGSWWGRMLIGSLGLRELNN